MLVQAFLGGLVVVGSDQQAGIRPVTLGITGQTNGFIGIVGTGTGNHRDTAIGHRHHFPDHAVVLFKTQGSGFTGGAHGNDSVGALLYMPVNQRAQTLPVH